MVYIVKVHEDLRTNDSGCFAEWIISIHWQVTEASEVAELAGRLDTTLIELDELRIYRFEYDYESETLYLDIWGGSILHSQVQMGLRDCIRNQILKLQATANGKDVRDLFKSINKNGTVDIEYKRKIYKQADVSFGPRFTIPSLVCEVP